MLADNSQVALGGGDLFLVPPFWLIISLELPGCGVVEMARRETIDGVTFVVESLELGRKVYCIGMRRGSAEIEGSDADGVTSGNNPRRSDGGVEKDKGKHAIEGTADVCGRVLVFVVLPSTGVHSMSRTNGRKKKRLTR
jgi:hypothetical protein